MPKSLSLLTKITDFREETCLGTIGLPNMSLHYGGLMEPYVKKKKHIPTLMSDLIKPKRPCYNCHDIHGQN